MEYCSHLNLYAKSSHHLIMQTPSSREIANPLQTQLICCLIPLFLGHPKNEKESPLPICESEYIAANSGEQEVVRL